jgi:hypothetical protein
MLQKLIAWMMKIEVAMNKPDPKITEFSQGYEPPSIPCNSNMPAMEGDGGREGQLQ